MEHEPFTRLDTDAADGISELAGRYALSGAAEDQLGRLGRLLSTARWAPTTVREPLQVRNDHLADSLVALELAPVRSAATIADLGAGAGLPGLCLAIGRPAARVWLVESNARKCRFIEHAIDVIGLENAIVVKERAECWSQGRDGCDLITARALAPLAVVAEYAAPLLVLGGTLVVWRGRRDPEDEAAAGRAVAELGLRLDDPIHVDPYPGTVNRHLYPLVKVAPTPDRFPRRPGMARKRPLGASGRGPSDRGRR